MENDPLVMVIMMIKMMVILTVIVMVMMANKEGGVDDVSAGAKLGSWEDLWLWTS